MLLNLKSKVTFIFIIACFSFTGAAFADRSTSSEAPRSGGAPLLTGTGQINADNINVRVDATISSAVACVLSKGQLVEVVSEVYDWYKIRLPKEAPAYVKKDLVECINTDPLTNPVKCLSAKVIKDRINIRITPSESSWIIGKINRLTVVSILSSEGDWYRIVPVYQSFGWVNKKFVNMVLDMDLAKGSQTMALQPKSPPLVKNEGPVVTGNMELSDQLIIEGKVSPYGIVLWRTATHKLITSLNKVYLLKGNRKSLNSLNYRKVKITGKLISPAKSRYPIIKIDIIEALN